MKTFITALRLLAVLTLCTGVIYPALVWGIGQSAFHDRAEGSLVKRDGQIVGSELIAQKMEDPKYFWARPSAGDFATVASGASNVAWTSAKLAERVKASPDAPADLVTTSGSGLDPDLSPVAVRSQLERVAAARGWNAAQRARCEQLVESLTEGGQFGPQHVNVLRLNLAIDRFAGGQ